MKTKFSGILTLLLALVVQLSFAQEKTISGTVSDDSGLPLPGATVLVKGTSSGTSSDFDGRYSIRASEGAILTFSFVGYTTIEAAVGSSNTVNVTLEEDAESLEEVVVTAFGKTKAKREVSSSVSIIDNAELTNVTNINPLESLSGKISGVDLSTPAQVGATSKVIIRGFSSLGSNQPLYIIDGSPINNTQNQLVSAAGDTAVSRTFDGGSGLNDLDPNNIETISVLKGAAAAALYGSRASNGAIIITTKRGRNNQGLKVDIVSSIDLLEVARVPHLQNDFGQGWNGQSYSSLPSGGQGASNENGSWGAPFDGQVRTFGHIINNSQQIKPYLALKDNIKDFYDIGSVYTNSIRLSGGGSNTMFSLGFTNTDSDGIIPTDADAFSRRVINASGGLSSEKFRLNVSANYVERDQNVVNTGQGDNAGEGEVLIQEIIQIPRDVSLVDLADYNNNIFNSNDNFYTPYSRNPYWTINENGNNLKSNRFYGNVNLNYSIVENLSATVQFGGDITNTSNKSFGAIINYSPDSPNALLGATTNAGGVTESKTLRKEYDTFFTLDYDNSITEDLTVDASLGLNYNERSTDFSRVQITDLSVPNFYELSNTAGRPIVTQNNSLRRTYGVFGSATVGYKNRFFLTLTGRNDWSSTLPVENNSFFYPSAGLSAIVIDNSQHSVKLRAAVARVAKDTGPYNTENALIPAVNSGGFGQILFPIGGQNAFELSGIIGNPNLKPEITDEYEFGTEISLFNSRVNIDFAYYNKDTEGVIISRPLPRSTGYASLTGNFIDLNNKGVELAVSGYPVKGNNFTWEVGYTFTKNENEVTGIAEGLDEILINSAFAVNFYAEKGKPLGVFKTRVPLTNDAGQVIVNPTTGIPTQTTDEVDIGNSQRDFIMGLKNTLTYKNLSLSFNFDWKEGGKMYTYTGRLLGFTGNSILTTYNDRNPFIVPNTVVDNGDDTYSENTTPITFENVTGFYSSSNNGSTEVNHVVDRSFIRLRDLSLSYRIPSSLVDQLGISRASITAYGKNLFLWTPDDNPYVDPEISTFGSDLASEFGEFSTNPSQRTYGVSLKVSF
ncbi:SusC/RagA family TonB-linked outer membrane protein [Flavivirga jejuensis]|uniref:SusC/RagA family TonB-linked outer membrane protein n=1 Tax=Flavivirga jejuensis TaxID=870487 RepID=A0ABT8WJI6_9FLAO|nr:SusC/RagA family TonB-linked outer membrane protein [Flavivirga jejuensis]MDO5973295.1 SusC/RagA family TonB-linked outer membrane protein [Flavivirga jejuensis]